MVNKDMKGMIGITGKSRKERVEIAKKGGSIKSEAKTRAAKLRGIKMMNPETLKRRALQLASDPDASALEIMRLIQVLINKEGVTTQQISELVDKLIRAHTAIHGTKSKSLNINIDLQKDMEEFDSKWKVYQIKKTKKKIVN